MFELFPVIVFSKVELHVKLRVMRVALKVSGEAELDTVSRCENMSGGSENDYQLLLRLSHLVLTREAPHILSSPSPRILRYPTHGNWPSRASDPPMILVCPKAGVMPHISDLSSPSGRVLGLPLVRRRGREERAG